VSVADGVTQGNCSTGVGTSITSPWGFKNLRPTRSPGALGGAKESHGAHFRTATLPPKLGMVGRTLEIEGPDSQPKSLCVVTPEPNSDQEKGRVWFAPRGNGRKAFAGTHEKDRATKVSYEVNRPSSFSYGLEGKKEDTNRLTGNTKIHPCEGRSSARECDVCRKWGTIYIRFQRPLKGKMDGVSARGRRRTCQSRFN